MVVALLVTGLGGLLGLVSRRIEKHLDTQDARLLKIEEAIGDLRLRAHFRRRLDKPS